MATCNDLLLSATLECNGLVLHLPITYEESYAHFNLSLKSITLAFVDNKVSISVSNISRSCLRGYLSSYVRKCGSQLKEITMHTWVTPPIILLRFTRMTVWGTHILSQEEFTTFTHIVADNSHSKSNIELFIQNTQLTSGLLNSVKMK